MHPSVTQIPLSSVKSSCANCGTHHLCLPLDLDDNEIERLDQMIGQRRKISRHNVLYRMGDSFHNLYAIRSGHFKTFQTNFSGDEQITGFQMPGDFLGMDAISNNIHQCYAVALEDSVICEISFTHLEQLFLEIPELQRNFHRMMSREITREQNVMLLLGNMTAEQRLSAFFLNLSERYVQRGYSGKEFQLRMTREEIGNYLGLTIESISRLLTRMRQQGLIEVKNRNIELLNIERLKLLLSRHPG